MQLLGSKAGEAFIHVETHLVAEYADGAGTDVYKRQAKDIARNTRGPIASIYYQGLMRIDQGRCV